MNWVLVFLFLAVRLPFLLVWAPTVEEPVFVGAGKYMVAEGDARQTALRDHPPLAIHLTSLPLLGTPTPTAEWNPNDVPTQVGLATLYESGDDAEHPVDPRIPLTLARMAVLMVGLIGMELVRRLGVRLYDARAGWIAGAAWALHPDIAAHGVLATTDLVAAVAAVYLAMSAVSYEQAVTQRDSDRARRLLQLGLAAGLALLAQHALLVPLAVTVGFAVFWRLARGREGATAGSGATIRLVRAAVLALFVLWAGYLFELRPLGDVKPAADAAQVESVPVPAATYVQSLVRDVDARTGAGDERDAPAYLDGRTSDEGFWSFPLVALLVKTPTGLLLLMLAGLIGWWELRRDRERIPDYLLALAAVPFVVAVASRLNLGARELLPIVPFLLLLGAAAVARLWVRRPRVAQGCAALIGLLLVAEWSVNFRDPLAFANVPSGGPAQLHERLADSDLDWGQDFWAFVRWGQQEELTEIHCRLHLAPGLFERELVRNDFLAISVHPRHEAAIRAIRAEDQDPTAALPKSGLAAISANELVSPPYRHLADVEPLHRIGHIRIFRLPPRDPPDER